MSDTITQRSKGCLVYPVITQRVFQKVTYIHVFLSIRPCTIYRVQRTICQRTFASTPHTFALQTAVCVQRFRVRPHKDRTVRPLNLARPKVQNAPFMYLVTQSPN
jgi:hypothetical protein